VEAITAELRTLLQSPDAELPAAALLKLEQLRAADRKARDLAGALATAQAAELASTGGRVADAHLEGLELPHLQEVARAFVARAPEKALLLTGGVVGAPVFVVAVGEAVPIEPAALGRDVAAALGGRGGGSGRLFQGRAGSLAGRDAARAAVEAGLKA
jgi:alanyl-tRNA synthetase